MDNFIKILKDYDYDNDDIIKDFLLDKELEFYNNDMKDIIISLGLQYFNNRFNWYLLNWLPHTPTETLAILKLSHCRQNFSASPT